MKFDMRPTPGWAIVFVSLAALSLAGCGRKGALDLPPSASGAQNAPALVENEAATGPNVLNSNYGAETPTAPRGRRDRPFIMDPILGEPYQDKSISKPQ